ncbi:hypothetical protein BCR41DRAFT_198189 [Lobosporangium transversale]|uniref:GP-PDE domain-containing protein n=1 Tax=Lobosporangium transversale TaxID=64571 RepID=A0A1Y2GD15_9FUNG|nr:hypothetical protein BCR41DRAFT_198189 [Lobosporangium transversale]ORZ04447.1 hypothetical protein BCR41DRAFT_198189 [Lobosporangium transversale]|eukprot:XP_021876555.1 hypothetical protein BCR41DRAFT_198189 [Lobosporangium transversale]
MCWTPLFYAASEGHTECVRVLLEAGCRVNVVDEHGETPIYYAASEGHADCVDLLVQAGGRAEGIKPPESASDIVMEAASSIPNSIMSAPAIAITDLEMAVDPEGLTTINDLDMELIPSLALPPPIIPFRIYGHNYLDKKHQVNLTLGHFPQDQPGTPFGPVRLYGAAQMSSFKLVISSRPDNGMIPHNVILPLGESRRICGFQVDSLDHFTVEFDIFPTFGSKPIGRAVALPSTFSSESSSVGKDIIPLFDAHLKVVGELAFEYTVIRPFQGVQLEVGGRLETYWKSTNSIDSVVSTAASSALDAPSLTPLSTSTYRGILPHPSQQTSLSGSIVPSYITASSLSGEYIQLSVQMTRDFVPVVFSSWRLPVEVFDVALSDVSFSQLQKFKESLKDYNDAEEMESINSTRKSSQWRRIIYDRWMSLEQALKILPKRIGINLEFKYPTSSEKRYYRLTNTAELNKFVDTILQTVYDSSSIIRHRSFMFSSFNPIICSTLNWKQPNYAVFFSTYGGYNQRRSPLITDSTDATQRNLKRKEPTDPEPLPSPKHGSAAAIFSSMDDGHMGVISSASSDTVVSASTSVSNSPWLSNVVEGSIGALEKTGGSSTFVETDRRCTSIKEAIKFARSNNLLGVICEATPLIQVPSLITHIKKSGLILASFGMSNRNPVLVQAQKGHGVDAFMVIGIYMDDLYQRQHVSPHGRGKTGLGLDIATGSVSGTLRSPRSGAVSRLQLNELEEGVLRYQNDIGPGSLGI